MDWLTITMTGALANAVALALAAENRSDESVPPSETWSAETGGEAEGTVDLVQGQIEKFQRLTVPVTIAGQGPFRFMVDTGSQATVIDPGLADRLALEPAGQAVLIGVASSKAVQTVHLDDIALGSRTFGGLRAPLLESRNIGADGILGIDSLQDQRVLFDFRRNRLEIDDAKTLGGKRGFEIVVRARRELGQLIIADAQLDGVRTAVIVDTGSQTSLGNSALREAMKRNARGAITVSDIHGATIDGKVGFARKLVMGRGELQNVAIAFADARTFEHLDLSETPALILGMEHLRLFDRVAIDFAQSRVLFDVPSRSIGPAMRKRFRW